MGCCLQILQVSYYPLLRSDPSLALLNVEDNIILLLLLLSPFLCDLTQSFLQFSP